MGMRFLYGGDENVPKLYNDRYVTLYTKNYPTVNYKRVNFVVCGLYLNKAVIK